MAFRSGDGLMESPGLSRRLFMSTSVLNEPIPRKSAVAVPVTGDTPAPFDELFRPALSCGMLSSKSSARAVP